MRKYISASLLLLAVFTYEAKAQYQNDITPPQGGVPIVAGGWYTAGTVFSNGIAYCVFVLDNSINTPQIAAC